MARLLYVTSTELREYAADRGVTLSGDDALVLLNKAQDYIDTTYSFCGTRVYETSAFPRNGLDGYDNSTIPCAVKQATLYAAMQIQIGTPFMEGRLADPQVKKVTIGATSISREYATNYKANPVQQTTPLQGCTSLLADADLLCGNVYGINNMIAWRG